MKTLVGMHYTPVRTRKPSLEKRRLWDRESLKGKLAKDLHAHVRARVEFQRAIAKSHPENMRPETLRRILEDSE